MVKKIKHIGVVQSVDGGCVKVRIVQSSACATCKMSTHCNSSESKEKIINVYLSGHEFAPGDEVMVMASYGVGLYAVTLSMLIPMLLVIVILMLMQALGFDELTSSLWSIASLLPYYTLLFVFRKKIDRKVNFEIEKP